MGTVRLIPDAGDVFADERGEGRTMRVSWHDERGIVVVSLWAGRICRGSFRLPYAELPRLRELLASVGADADEAPATPGDGPGQAGETPATGVQAAAG